jgi:predicted phage-related endonuclease
MFLNSSALKTNIKLKHILFQNRMDSIQNNLKPEVKEETEEEKIDIENHFHPVISSCEEDQLTRSVC